MSTDRSTLLDIAKARDANGMPAKILEILSQRLPLFADGYAIPSNAPLGHRIVRRSALPTVNFVKINQGVTRSKGTTRQLVDTMGLISGRCEVDTKLRDVLGANHYEAEKRRQQVAFIESIGQLAENRLLYGDELTEPAAFTGLAPRMATLNTSYDIKLSQVKSMGSVSGSDGTSLYVVDWGEDGAAVLYPGDGDMTAGVRSRNVGEGDVLDADGATMRADVSLFDLAIGLTVRDPRHIGRLANIDVSDANGASPSQGSLFDALTDLLSAMPSAAGMRRVIYCHHRLFAAFSKQAANKSNGALVYEDYLNIKTPMFNGIPFRASDQMSVAESTVS
jgi:hypothetical protein